MDHISKNEKSSSNQQQTEHKSTPLDDSDDVIPEKYRHPDPVLSRLRLNDQFGKPITNPKLFFRDCKVVGFFFATVWKYNKDSFQNQVLELCNRNPHRFKCIYVSVDANKEEFDVATREKSWINMIWEDGSNVDEEGKPSQLENVEFITPEEQELIQKIVNGEQVDNKKDTRPISRVGLCAGLNMMFAPNLAIYHLESKTWLEKNVSLKSISSKEKREVALETWERGERLGLSWMDIILGLKWAIIITILGIGYRLLVHSDDSYNIIHLVEKLMAPNDPPSSQSTPPPPMMRDQPRIAHYNEF